MNYIIRQRGNKSYIETIERRFLIKNEQDALDIAEAEKWLIS
jgi:hypothetical protein